MLDCPNGQDPYSHRTYRHTKEADRPTDKYSNRIHGEHLGRTIPLREWEYGSLFIRAWEPDLMCKAAPNFNHILWTLNIFLWNIYNLLDLLIILLLTFLQDFMTCLQGSKYKVTYDLIWPFQQWREMGGSGAIIPILHMRKLSPEREGYWSQVIYSVSGRAGTLKQIVRLGSRPLWHPVSRKHHLAS